MSDARDRILGRLRRQRPQPAAQRAPAARESAAPASPAGERIARFVRLLEAVRAEVHRCRRDDWPELLWRICGDKSIGRLAYGAGGPLATTLENGWRDRGETVRLFSPRGPIEQWKDSLFSEADAAVTSARWGIARTGTLVLWPDSHEPRTLSLVPPVHFVVLDVDDLYDDFATLIEAEGWRSGMPTNAVLISGPSKTADIEQTLSYGIHGPVELIVLLTG